MKTGLKDSAPKELSVCDQTNLIEGTNGPFSLSPVLPVCQKYTWASRAKNFRTGTPWKTVPRVPQGMRGLRLCRNEVGLRPLVLRGAGEDLKGFLTTANTNNFLLFI